MGFLFGVPHKLIKRVTEIEIDSRYYDNDVVPSSQDMFTYTIDEENKIAQITGFVNNNISEAVIPYRIKYGDTASHMYATTTSIANGAFKDNPYLTTMTMPNTLHEIPTKCFANCTALSRVIIPRSIRTIKEDAFYGCTNLQSMTIGIGVTTIKQDAFANCTKLNSIFIPYNVTEIADDVFKDSPKVKIICYKDSKAEEYAKAHNIPYSLISYTLDDDITKDSENLVTSGVIYKWKKFLDDKINAHINNKNNPHDSSKFKDVNLYGNSIFDVSKEDISNSELSRLLVNKEYVDHKVNETIDPSTGSGYQTIVDNKLKTDSKIIPIAINEVNDKVNSINIDLKSGWNEVSTNKLYDFGWVFLNKPFCYKNGIPVDFKIRNYKDNIKNNLHCFEIYVPVDCTLECAVTPSKTISGHSMDYMIINYYYTGNDGKDLDTVTELNSTNVNGTVGYNQGDSIVRNSKTLLAWAGDNTGGGSENANTKYYESIYLDLNAITSECGNDCEITLYGTWFNIRGDGYINTTFNCYTGTNATFTSNNNKKWSISGNNIQETYSNPIDMRCYIATKKGAPDYKNNYTPAFKLIIHSQSGTNIRTIKIEALS